ncbi:hypothetical protein [Pseudoroseicyclus tamaricis]|uniref:Uncharacterized protein n=1 Tax=Pseudoroseicyclus tamaricis TaxID=2705421 RepID=A0A6B2JF06_9RHOB|nr:hypothetical protein [Pseudoroseicyclus tamaricis]NDU99532.1 hypothetical protein [Pseudoroseicyclus tamaricis]
MDPADIFARTEAVRLMLVTRFRAKGETLETALASTRRRLPRRIRREGRVLAEAETLGQHPRIAKQVDPARFSRAETEVTRYLRRHGRGERLKTRTVAILAILAFNVLLFGGIAVAVLRSQGRI